MIDILPDGFLVFAPGAGRHAVLMAVIVFVASAYFFLKRKGARPAPVLALTLAGGILGAWVADGLLTGRFVPPGFSLLGAAFGGPLGACIATVAMGLPRWSTLDALAWPSLGAAAIARLGCFLAGCELGGPAEHALAVRYRSGTAAFDSLVSRGELGAGASMTPPMQPLPLLEIAGMIVTIVLMLLVARRPRVPGTASLFAFGGYLTSRGVAEYMRRGPAMDPLGTSSLTVVLVPGILLLFAAVWRIRRAFGATGPS